MQASFTNLVGTIVVPVHSFDTDELSDLTPALETARLFDGMAAEVSEAQGTYSHHINPTTHCG